jgi:polyisoprenoid-binding protein YceI
MNRIAGAAALLIGCAAFNVHAADWTMNPAASELAFTATFEGSPAPGLFRKFDATVRFDPDRLAESRIDVSIAVPSADMSSDEINKAIAGPDWFDAKRFPVAEFHSAEVRSAGANRFVATGTLKVKGVARAIELPFSWQREGDTATLRGELTFDRGTFGIGLGEWASTAVIGAGVKVRFSVRLRRRG